MRIVSYNTTMRKQIVKEPPPKRRGRPPGTKNAPKPEAIQSPESNTLTLKVLHLWEDKVILGVDGSESERFRMSLTDFAKAVSFAGYNKQFGFTIPVRVNGDLIFYSPKV